MTAPVLDTRTLEFTQTINAPMEHLWSLLSSRDDLCDWLCYDAHVRFEEGGFATFIWHEGPHAYGVYKAIEERSKIVMTWQDGTDQQTKVKIKLEETSEGVQINLWHKGFTDDERADYYQNFWDFRLRNLKSIAETGAHLDITERVIIGILVEPHAEELDAGIRVMRVVDGYSAEKAGLQGGDVILRVNDTPINDQSGIHDVVGELGVGTVVKVDYSRDGQAHTADLKLLGYPIPPIPADFAEMAANYQAEHERINTALTTALDGITDDVARVRPADDQWSIKEILAHMILTQRHTLDWLSTYAHGPRRINGYTRDASRIAAIIEVFNTVPELVAELERRQDETVAIINNMPAELVDRHDYRWWITFEVGFSEEVSMSLIRQIQRNAQLATA